MDTGIAQDANRSDKGRWQVSVNERVYGPYTDAQLRGWIAEGRIAAFSQISPDGAQSWMRADESPVFGHLFERAAPVQIGGGTPRGGLAARDTRAQGAANLVIAAEIRGRSASEFEQAVMNLGPAYKVLGNVWLVHTDQPANGVRNLLVQYIGKSDQLVVVDASHDKAVWFNLGPEGEARARRVWHRATDRAA